ncbi:Brp/Blh family beta-carotene 15,15'-dioxygenase [Fibrella sp. HMF5335]|uniref:Probable beta-carotene 15,15'-dioxygenase n=1 Tax=Fibrella rubiginis TaxID=2817060 RepID=A0A939GBZ2_9BACT|nr:Brp/Blh family beta-carotene 15,15'-dioxygenase [Fibrella rubiginis]MBO0936109.1 Brp/Blh family beta-carotene 15,15'-dioxygenase [Fibrella rubiginis]
MEALNWTARRIAQTPSLVSIGCGMLLIVWQLTNGYVPQWAQWLVVVLLLFGIGIPHGAIDHLIDEETARRTNRGYSIGAFVVKYLLTMGLYGLLWYFFPTASLLIFLLISAWHFGETDIEHVPLTLPWTVVRFGWGYWVLSFLLLTHPTDVTPILARLTQGSPAPMQVWAWCVAHTALWLGGGLAAIAGLFGLAQQTRRCLVDGRRLVRLGCLLLLTWPLPLLVAFALYFGGWHALSSFQTIYHYLKNRPQNPLSARQVWFRSLPFTAIALLGLLLTGSWWYLYAQTWDPLPLLFLFLSLITLPHLNVMHGMNSRTQPHDPTIISR